MDGLFLGGLFVLADGGLIGAVSACRRFSDQRARPPPLTRPRTPFKRLAVYAELGINGIMPSSGLCRVIQYRLRIPVPFRVLGSALLGIKLCRLTEADCRTRGGEA